MDIRIKRYADFLLFGLLAAGFVYTAAQRLADVPVPDSDEAMTLQVPYEMLTRGRLAFPMYQYLGGNIQNVWHSYTPVFFGALASYLKVFGWGLTQARTFNLIASALLLLLVYVIGRSWFDWVAAAAAVWWIAAD